MNQLRNRNWQFLSSFPCRKRILFLSSSLNQREKLDRSFHGFRLREKLRRKFRYQKARVIKEIAKGFRSDENEKVCVKMENVAVGFLSFMVTKKTKKK